MKKYIKLYEEFLFGDLVPVHEYFKKIIIKVVEEYYNIDLGLQLSKIEERKFNYTFDFIIRKGQSELYKLEKLSVLFSESFNKKIIKTIYDDSRIEAEIQINITNIDASNIYIICNKESVLSIKNLLLKNKLDYLTNLDEGVLSTIFKYLPMVPMFMTLLGSATRVLGKNFNNEDIIKIGNFLTDNSKLLQNKFNSAISTVIKPYLKPGYNSDKVTNDLINLIAIKHFGRNTNADPSMLINALSISKVQDEALKLLPEVLKIK